MDSSTTAGGERGQVGPADAGRSGERAEADRFWAAWDAFFAALRQARGRAAARVADGELTLSQFKLLSALEEAGPRARSGELAAALDVSQPTVTRMLSGLERDGVVERVRSSEDRRAVEVRLTDAGRERFQRRRGQIERHREALYESLPAEQRRRAGDLLAHLAEALEAL